MSVIQPRMDRVPLPSGFINEPMYYDETISDDRRGALIVSLAVLFTAISFSAILLRIYAKRFIAKRFSLDDYLVFLASFCSLAVLGVYVDSVKHGLGRHIQFVADDDRIPLLRGRYIRTIVSWIGINFARFSLCVYLFRLSPRGSKTRRAIWVLAAFSLVTELLVLVMHIFRCLPVGSEWDPLKRSSCLSTNKFAAVLLFVCTGDVVSNIILATIPIFLFSRSPFKQNHRTVFMAMIFLGYLVCVTSIVRLEEQIRSLVYKEENFVRGDFFDLWNSIELNLGIFVISLPTYGAVFSRLTNNAYERTLALRRTSSFAQSHSSRTRLREIQLSPLTLPHRRGDPRTDEPETSTSTQGDIPDRKGLFADREKPQSPTSPSQYEYTVEVSASPRSAERHRRASEIEPSLAERGAEGAGSPDVPTIVRTTHVSVHMDDPPMDDRMAREDSAGMSDSLQSPWKDQETDGSRTIDDVSTTDPLVYKGTSF